MSDGANGEPTAQAAENPKANETKGAGQQSQGEKQQTTSAEPAAAPTLSNAELKKRAKAEKQAKRAQAKGTGAPPQGKLPAQKEGKPQNQPKGQKEVKSAPKETEKGRPQPTRRHNSVSNVAQSKEVKKEPKKEPKQLGLFFGHLYKEPRQHSILGATKEVHPAVLALGLQYSSYVICGSTARCVAMLLAFKSAIESYSTPTGHSLARHLNSHHLSPQIDYLRVCRPLSISMGNAIRWLKEVVSKIDPSTPESEAKDHLMQSIDDFIVSRVTAADQLISQTAVAKIQPGDMILTFARSSIVEASLLRAQRQGIPFSVIVVDSKPLFEGKRLARNLAQHGVNVTYCLLSGAAHAIKSASKVFLGAHAMLSNGRLYSRVGTAIVSMLAAERDIPVIVLCESLKFTERVALDSIVGNEIAPAEELLTEKERAALTYLKPHITQTSGSEAKEVPESEHAKKGEVVRWFQDEPNLQLLQVLYDVTPAEYIKMVITEYGSLPPSSVPVVHRLSTNM